MLYPKTVVVDYHCHDGDDDDFYLDEDDDDHVNNDDDNHHFCIDIYHKNYRSTDVYKY